MSEQVERPHAGWWVAIGGGLGLTYVLGLWPGAHAWWVAHVTPLPSLPVVQLIGVLAAATHLAEALYARRLARRIGRGRTASGWFWQTLALGFPSLRLLRRRGRVGCGGGVVTGARGALSVGRRYRSR